MSSSNQLVPRSCVESPNALPKALANTVRMEPVIVDHPGPEAVRGETVEWKQSSPLVLDGASWL